MSKNDKRLYRRRTRRYKDSYYTPKNLFQPKPREYYESLTDIKITDEQREKLKKIWDMPQPRVVPEEFVITMKCAKKPDSLMAFIKSIIPRRRMTNDHYVYLVKKKPNGFDFKGNYLLSSRTKDVLLPIVFQAIDNGTI